MVAGTDSPEVSLFFDSPLTLLARECKGFLPSSTAGSWTWRPAVHLKTIWQYSTSYD